MDDDLYDPGFGALSFVLKYGSYASLGGAFMGIGFVFSGALKGFCAVAVGMTFYGSAFAQDFNVNGNLAVGSAGVPAKDIEVFSGNTPTVRFNQSGGGFSPYTWDVAGNEANFFIRDVTDGNKLPFRIFPGAPTNSLTIRNTGVGIGTSNATAALDVNGSVRLRGVSGCSAGVVSDAVGMLSCGDFVTVTQETVSRALLFGAVTDGSIVNFSGTAGNRVLAGVRAGTVAAGSTQAINGGQLHATGQSIASALGGRAAVNPDGTVSAPAYSIRGTERTGVGATFQAVDTEIGGLRTQVDAIIAGTAGTNPFVAVKSSRLGASAAGNESVALGGAAAAGGANATAIGSGAQAAGASSTALGANSVASHSNATALGAGAATSRADQFMFGTNANTYTMPGVTSAASRAAQSGPVQVVTSDAQGNLAARDIASFFPDVQGVADFAAASRKEARQGIAAAMAMTTAPIPSEPGKTSWATNVAAFRGEWAGGFSMAHRLDIAFPLAITGGYGYGGGENHGVRFGLAGEF